MSNNTIYEITRQLSDKNNIQKDINDAITLVSDMFKKRYTDKIYSALSTAENNAKLNPSKELNLIYAIKPFLSKDSLENYDKLVNAMLTVNTLSSIKNEMTPILAQSEQSAPSSNTIDSAIRSDGVYEIDEDCINASTPVYTQNNFTFDPTLLIIAILLFTNK